MSDSTGGKTSVERGRPMPDLSGIETLGTGEICVDGSCGIPGVEQGISPEADSVDKERGSE